MMRAPMTGPEQCEDGFRPRLLAAAVAVHVAWLVVALGLVIPTTLPERIERATHGLVTPTLGVSAAAFVLVVVGVLWFGGRIPMRRLGLDWRRAPVALAWTAAVWGAAQVLLIALAIALGQEIVFAAEWSVAGPIVGMLLGQLLGNALVEEVVYRGFALPQAFAALSGSHMRRLVIGIAISQLVFAVTHIPARLHDGYEGVMLLGSVAAPFAGGVLFALTYLRTGNLFVAIGLHALVNAPTPLVEPAIPPGWPVLAAAILGVVLWPAAASSARAR
jgi:uncharacterized protein